ncbi:DUF1266 domain-containing protein [Streptomyces megasporus]|uniref:DUF1266 domain-containing protein n=1 Tax=Streptomyces megasporus TaxID=44060 RepID=UPI0004E27B5C|nr:DUF1266 domain-containing protein [Streptomyces megasporus]
MTTWSGTAAGWTAAGQGPDGSPYAPWQPPTDVEQSLYEAKTRGDWVGYFDVLAGADLFHALPRPWVEANPGYFGFFPYWDPRTHRHYVAILTEGMLPCPAPDPVFFEHSLGWYAEKWDNPDWWLAVNPGSPCEAYFAATPEHRRMWAHHAEKVSWSARRGTLRTLRVGGVHQGPVARGLACGALLCVNNGSLWNAMGWHGTGFGGERRRLEEWWGITTREEWMSAQERLLKGEMSNFAWEFVLEVRRAIAREYGGPVEIDHWRQVVGRVVRDRAEQAAAQGAEGLPDPGAEIRRLQQLIGRIVRYEARFRADGLLREGEYVTSVLAWDYGRASKMARWGLGARFCDVTEAESAVVRAGRVSRVTYKSWEAFSAGYILGRCLHFDDEEFGDWYENMLRAHQILTTDPESPWRTIPW